jgi:formylglycine-generating enzyme
MKNIILSKLNVVLSALLVLLPEFLFAEGLVNGSFESGLTGWTTQGNQSLASASPYAATDGTKLVAFNNGNTTPNGVLMQSFSTTPGSKYIVIFDVGVLAYNNNEQQLQVELSGASVLASESFSIARSGGGNILWFAKSVPFTAETNTTTLKFSDRSVTSINLDLLLDHVRVELVAPGTGSLVNGSFEAGFDGWTVVGNQEIQASPPYVPTDGSSLVSFNSQNSVPNGRLSQTIATVPGITYALTFDAGFLAYNRSEQKLGIQVDGNASLVARDIILKSINGEVLRWTSQSLLFTADSSETELTFLDRSNATVSVDLLLDNVAIINDPFGFAYIPAGNFLMGDTFPNASNLELPVRDVYLDAFYIAKHEVTAELWNQVWQWAKNHGYTDLPAGNSKGDYHPVHSVSWYDVVKWCNARSEMEGKAPCYTVLGVIYRTGYPESPNCNRAANGYRLPTEAEWEKSVRGGFSGLRFPWGDTITHSNANYVSTSFYSYDLSPTRGYHPKFADGVFPYSAPIGKFEENGYGLYDIVGNQWEWCGDWWADSYDSSEVINPTGPDAGIVRVLRGGSWGDLSNYSRNAARSATGPFNTHPSIGARLVRSAVQ